MSMARSIRGLTKPRAASASRARPGGGGGLGLGGAAGDGGGDDASVQSDGGGGGGGGRKLTAEQVRRKYAFVCSFEPRKDLAQPLHRSS
jgi:hypothetical protein